MEWYGKLIKLNLHALYSGLVLSWPEDGRSLPNHVAKYHLIVIIASCLMYVVYWRYIIYYADLIIHKGMASLRNIIKVFLCFVDDKFHIWKEWLRLVAMTAKVCSVCLLCLLTWLSETLISYRKSEKKVQKNWRYVFYTWLTSCL